MHEKTSKSFCAIMSQARMFDTSNLSFCVDLIKRNIFVAKHVPITFIDNFERYIGFKREGKKKYM